tara:strand:- start:1027 stop:1245 length:219 start_codon:yes stop_codon:yes gene_type:complete
MKSFLINIKNLFPYLVLISIYFFFVNIEARNGKNILEKDNKELNELIEPQVNISNSKDKTFTISIPVVPYNE